jgi:hypothetical protein
MFQRDFQSSIASSQVWYFIPIIPAFGRLKQEGLEFKVRPLLKKKPNKTMKVLPALPYQNFKLPVFDSAIWKINHKEHIDRKTHSAFLALVIAMTLPLSLIRDAVVSCALSRGDHISPHTQVHAVFAGCIY